MKHLNTPGIIGHRCAGYLAPENTLAAVYTAIRMGLDGIECDIQATSDGELILFHDTTLNRTTDRDGTLAEYSLEEIRTLDAGSWFDYIYAWEQVPTLREALDLIDGRLTAFLELKMPSSVDRTADIIQESRAGSWCTIISFSEYVLAQCAKRIPDVPRAILIHPETPPDPVELINHITSIPADMVGLSPRWLDSDLTGKVKQAGIRIMTGPVDTGEQCRESFPTGPDYILTNQPDIVLDYVRDQASA
jgi:glycerophosphoryl diester phosphodiesterase